MSSCPQCAASVSQRRPPGVAKLSQTSRQAPPSWLIRDSAMVDGYAHHTWTSFPARGMGGYHWFGCRAHASGAYGVICSDDRPPRGLGLWLQCAAPALRQGRQVQRHRRCDPGRLQLDDPADRLAGSRTRSRRLRLLATRQYRRRRQRCRPADHDQLRPRAGLLPKCYERSDAVRPQHVRGVHAGGGRALRRARYRPTSCGTRRISIARLARATSTRRRICHCSRPATPG